MTPDEREFYKQCMVALLGNQSFYHREKYISATDEDMINHADYIARCAVEAAKNIGPGEYKNE